MKKFSVITVATLILSMFINVTSSFASAEKYYYKDAEYNEYVTSDAHGTDDLGGSSIVITANAAYAGNDTGKEQVRAFTRSWNVKQYYNALTVAPDVIKVSLMGNPPYGVRHFMRDMTPEENSLGSSPFTFSWLANGRWSGFAVTLVEGLVTLGSGNIQHEYPLNEDRKGLVKILYPDVEEVDLPRDIPYDSIPPNLYNSSTGEGEALGFGANFLYEYILQPGVVGELRAQANAHYDMRYNAGSEKYPYPGYEITVRSGVATLDHTITGKGVE